MAKLIEARKNTPLL